ncbi:MAG TPA: GntR family transcriptional regulator [Limnochordia bacterium]|nr:GntR family transcriptional regulator [Limnochordia bacterium]
MAGSGDETTKLPFGTSLLRGGDVPLYEQIKQTIRAAIDTGELCPGDRLPGEPELCRALGVSKMTLRQALGDLSSEGVLERKRGQGTIVRGPRVAIELPYFRSYTTDMQMRGYRPGTRLLGLDQLAASAREARALGIAPNDRLIRLSRLRLADDSPMALETTLLPAALLPGFLDLAKDMRSLYAVFERVYDIRPTRAVQELQAVAATAEEAGQLGVAPGAALLMIESVLYDQHDRPVEFTKSRYRGDRYQLHFERLRSAR